MTQTGEQTHHNVTAWDLCSDWWWVGTHLAFVKGGRVGYEDATAAKSHTTVLLRRLDTDLHEVRRYVAWNTPMVVRAIT